MNTYYTAYSVLKQFLEDNNYSVVNVDLIGKSPDKVTLWVDSNDKGITHFTCIKIDCTQFIIMGYDDNFRMCVHIGYDFAEITKRSLKENE